MNLSTQGRTRNCEKDYVGNFGAGAECQSVYVLKQCGVVCMWRKAAGSWKTYKRQYIRIYGVYKNEYFDLMVYN